jgi:OOP family OmpA-OmpF porin
MKNPHTLNRIALAALGALLALPALAQDTTADSFYYGGISAGKTRANLDGQGIASRLLGPGQTATLTDNASKHNGYKVFGGYQFNRNWAVEVGFFHWGQFTFDAATTPAGTLHGQVRMQGANADLVGLLPLSTDFSVLGRAGINFARTRDTFTTTGAATVANFEPSDRKLNYKFGLGLQYALADWIRVRAEAERYRVSDAVGGKVVANMYSVGLIFPFGRAAAPVRRAMVEPAYMPSEPAPAPEVVVQAPTPPMVEMPAPIPKAAPIPQRVSFSAESMFTFDRAEIQPEGKAKLDDFVRELRGTEYGSVTVEGHTDRLGSAAYNQSLSQRRADAVKAYLVEVGQLDSAKVNAVGKSESTPVTQPGDCKGNKQTAALVACLQPDRRVEVEVSGVR